MEADDFLWQLLKGGGSVKLPAAMNKVVMNLSEVDKRLE